MLLPTSEVVAGTTGRTVGIRVGNGVGSFVGKGVTGNMTWTADDATSLSGQMTFSKQYVPMGHIPSPGLHVCSENEHDASTSARDEAQ